MTKHNEYVFRDRMPYLSRGQLERIHDASIQILNRVGVRFNHSEVDMIFSRNGFKVDQGRVFCSQAQILKALEACPAEFTIYGRNPNYDANVGGDFFVLLPTGGATMVMDTGKELRPGSIADYEICCKLVQTSKVLDLNGFLMIQPNDIPSKSAHLEMVLRNLLLCEKPFVAATHSIKAARDALEMADIVWGGREKIMKKPVMAAIITAASPLQYTADQADCILQYARSKQPIVLITMPLAGTTGPVNLLALMAQINAEILAGIVLVQSINPGTPVVYGSIAAPIDMKTMIPAVGAAETVQLSYMTAQMAFYYRLPCRTGGCLTDAQLADYQAGAESGLLMSTALRAGANLVFQACGLLASGASMSFTKWLLDEDLCANIRKVLSPLVLRDQEVDITEIEQVGIGGCFLTHDNTLRDFRQLSRPDVFNRKNHVEWLYEGGASSDKAASIALTRRLEAYCQPTMDQGLKQELEEFVQQKAAEYREL
jgi:trimethylamine--corrinoid protein Co-methyltransferase